MDSLRIDGPGTTLSPKRIQEQRRPLLPANRPKVWQPEICEQNNETNVKDVQI